MSIDDGLQWFKNKAKKIEDIFAKSFALNIKEGYTDTVQDPNQQLRALVSQNSTLGPSVLTPENINNIFPTFTPTVALKKAVLCANFLPKSGTLQ
jgi:hypothetical protein